MINNTIGLTKQLISVLSVKEDPKALSEVLVVADKELKGLKSKKFVSNGVPSVLYYNTPKLPKKFKVILNAHLDVVPGNVSQYKAMIKDDKLYGRGALDMKGAVACEILVFKELASKVNYPLGLQLVTDEEIGGFNGTKYQIEKGIRADFVITGEPTNFNITNMTKGVLWLKLISKGISAHGARPWKGKNAIRSLNQTLDVLLKKYPIPQKEVWKTTLNVGNILSTNNSFNKVPDYAEAWVDIRYIPEEEKTILKNIKKILPNNIDISIVLFEPPHKTPANHKDIKSLSKVIKKVTGKNPQIIKQHGSNDVRHFTKIGCNGVEFGPVGKGLHTDNEWVSIESLEIYYKILKDFLVSL